MLEQQRADLPCPDIQRGSRHRSEILTANETAEVPVASICRGQYFVIKMVIKILGYSKRSITSIPEGECSTCGSHYKHSLSAASLLAC